MKKSAAKPGASRIGGAPEVPLGFMWPTVDGTPLLFLLQIALTDLPSSVRHDLGLEAKGSLAIFIHPDAADGNETCIVMPIAALSRAPIASPGRAIAFSEIWTPPPPSLSFEQRFDQRIYEAAFANHARAQKKALHQIGGHPNAVQDSPENHGERLLLQLDTEDDAELMWNDAGRLYVLVGRDLTDARCEIQST